MEQGMQSYPMSGYGAATAAERNRVLRNTYWLLALTMVPTVLGAWLGMALGINKILSPGIGLVVFLVGAFGFMFAIEKNKNSAAGVPILLGFTFFMGLMLSRMLAIVLGMGNGASLVMMAFAGTGAVFLGMATLSTLVKRDLSSMAKFMTIGAILVLVAGIANFFIQSAALMITLAVLIIGIFSFFILYDLKRVREGEETNYITATLGVYLSLYNIFRACWRSSASAAAAATDCAAANRPDERRGPSGPRFHCSNTAIDSTCAVCGNMFTTPASVQR